MRPTYSPHTDAQDVSRLSLLVLDRWRGLASMTIAAFGIAFFNVGAALAQDASDDAALEALIQAIDDDDKGKSSGEPQAKPPTAPEPKADAPGPRKPPPQEELSGKDKELESLLESLGGSIDEPTTTKDQPQPPSGSSGEGDADQQNDPGQGDQDRRRNQAPKNRPDAGATDQDRALEEELEELAGRRRKRRGEDQSQGEGGGGQSSGPMEELIKEMRDVERRLGEPDTSEGTRERQRQLVKRMETLIEQIQQGQQQQQQSRSTQQRTAQQGGKPGEQPGDEPGSNPGGAPNQRPARPTDRRALAGGKDAWGHLPPELRQEMENIAKEESLPASQELIRRYYLSIARGRLSRGE